MSENDATEGATEPTADGKLSQPGSAYEDIPPQDEPTYPNTSALMTKATGDIRYRYFGATDVGLVREHNEDNFMVADIDLGTRGVEQETLRIGTVGSRGLILAVCDGMGGAAAGEVVAVVVGECAAVLGVASVVEDDHDLGFGQFA